MSVARAGTKHDKSSISASIEPRGSFHLGSFHLGSFRLGSDADIAGGGSTLTATAVSPLLVVTMPEQKRHAIGEQFL